MIWYWVTWDIITCYYYVSTAFLYSAGLQCTLPSPGREGGGRSNKLPSSLSGFPSPSLPHLPTSICNCSLGSFGIVTCVSSILRRKLIVGRLLCVYSFVSLFPYTKHPCLSSSLLFMLCLALNQLPRAPNYPKYFSSCLPHLYSPLFRDFISLIAPWPVLEPLRDSSICSRFFFGSARGHPLSFFLQPVFLLLSELWLPILFFCWLSCGHQPCHILFFTLLPPSLRQRLRCQSLLIFEMTWSNVDDVGS